MRTRIGNPFREAHGRVMRCIDWIAPAGVNPNDLPALIETEIPALKIFHRGDSEVNGFINTSRRPDGSLYISLQLYDNECTDPQCLAGHGSVNIRIAPVITPAQIIGLRVRVGEMPGKMLTDVDAPGILRGLGFTDNDAPLRLGG